MFGIVNAEKYNGLIVTLHPIPIDIIPLIFIMGVTCLGLSMHRKTMTDLKITLHYTHLNYTIITPIDIYYGWVSYIRAYFGSCILFIRQYRRFDHQ